MSTLLPPQNGSLEKDVVLRLRTGRKVKSHAGSDPTELAARVFTEGSYVDSRNEVEFADAIVGPPGPVPIHIGPTPPSDTSLLWVDTS